MGKELSREQRKFLLDNNLQYLIMVNDKKGNTYFLYQQNKVCFFFKKKTQYALTEKIENALLFDSYGDMCQTLDGELFEHGDIENFNCHASGCRIQSTYLVCTACNNYATTKLL